MPHTLWRFAETNPIKKTHLAGGALEISRLSFGAARLHRVFSSSARLGLLTAAFDAGYSHYDLAPYYGFGLTEADFGKWRYSNSDTITVASKFGLYPPGANSRGALQIWSRKLAGKVAGKLSRPVVDWSVRRAKQSLELTLKRIRRECVDVLFLHEPDLHALDVNALVDWLTQVKTEGKIRWWGVAGDARFVEPLFKSGSALTKVIQTRDDGSEEFKTKYLSVPAKAHFTYGYLRQPLDRASRPYSAKQVITEALQRNSHGSVLVGSTKAEHIRELASLAY
jgi:aryl-alcohol dehydrogenase-like predicted oxidoreductase